MRTRITEMLGIEHPIIQGAMTWVSFPPLAAAVSDAGGLGILGAAFMSPEELRDSIREIKRLTPKPYGVNFAADNPIIDKLSIITMPKGNASHASLTNVRFRQRGLNTAMPLESKAVESPSTRAGARNIAAL